MGTVKQGHKEFLKKSRNERGPWTKYRLGPVEFCRIIGLNYSIDTGLGSTSCMIQLEFTDASSQAYRQSFTLTLPELTDHPDFIVEKSRYDASMAKGWVPRDHCKVWWANGVDYKGQWWDGRIKSIKLKSDSFPGSPWEKYLVSYKGAPEPTAHSPWELFDKYCQIPGWSVPQIDEKLKEDLLNAVCSVEDTLYDDEVCTMGFFSVPLVVLMPKSVTIATLVFGVVLTHCSFTALRNILWSGVASIELLGNPSTGYPLILQEDLGI